MSNPVSYVACDSFTREQLAVLDLRDDTFNEPLRAPGMLSGKLRVDTPDRGRDLRSLLVRDRTAVYAVMGGRPIWGGLLLDDDWDPVTGELIIEVMHWSGWFQRRQITPNAANNAHRDHIFTFTQVEQHAIADALVQYALNVPDAPSIAITYAPTIRLRDASWESTSFKTVYEAITEVAHRADGFDWAVDVRVGEDGLIEPYVTFYYPERQSYSQVGMLLIAEPGGGNLIDYRFPRSAAERVSRMWLTGEGSPPDVLVANAAHPYLGQEVQVYAETSSSEYNSVKNPATLAGHARREVGDRAEQTTTVPVWTSPDNPVFSDYLVGDRARLRLLDNWLDVDLPSVRIVERTYTGPQPDDGAPAQVELQLDVTDAYGPPVEVPA